MAMLPCKLPLIVIVAQWKLYSEYSNRGRGIQISVTGETLFTGQ